ncbi:CRISPR-associated endonuclease Cas2 [Halorhodospira halophila]|uniref:CRISPR-associated endoribonuclease Cas2 n=1 Tax=Halorhodospira halophila (strain DSM 244 / SL1) TaxID=349124 RepID=A1WUP3_HALHL|nr:CRISPR-associated endonuclease Cas2 [Halorhodospira halophila]ABM61405.1 CRISPR-associated protein, Cas2 family [Halorhodospira halophila SL1]MBK1728647.1 CRISPR-associated endonuclease Cas2 [Halorhodospira halophila]
MGERAIDHLVCYDIRKPARLRRVHRLMKEWGVPLQYSVFYCRLVPSARHQLAEALRREIDERVDDVRIYALQPQGEGTYQGPAPLPPGLVLPGLSLRPQFPEAD